MVVNGSDLCFFTVQSPICLVNYALEWVSEAESTPIRSAVKFYFGCPKMCSTFSKHIFSIDPKIKMLFLEIFLEIFNTTRSATVQGKTTNHYH